MHHARVPAERRSRSEQVLNRVAVQFLFVFPVLCGSVAAQSLLGSLPTAPGTITLCDPIALVSAAHLTLAQRACWYASELVSPWAAVRAGASIGLHEWRFDDYTSKRHPSDNEVSDLLAQYYVRRTARETGEFLAGYFNREDPRPRISGETTFSKRLKSAVLSVVIVKDEAGTRPAFGPLVGSFGSAFAGSAFLEPLHVGPALAVRGASFTYASYFGRALYQEFRPDIAFHLRRLLHKQP